MFLTEEEASHHWCPYGLQPHYAGSSVTAVNRVEGGQVPSCIASSCMAWRWSEPKRLRDIDLVTSDVVDTEPRRGFCGAFGTPNHGD